MLKKKRILVADADGLESDFFVLMLDKLGFSTEAAGNGSEAMSKLENSHDEKYDLIILESALPGRISGWEVLQKIKKDPVLKEIPVIMLSSLDDVKEEVGAFDLGVEDYIRKPFNFSVVLARIRRVIGLGMSGGPDAANVKATIA
jgi:DNA-binding response OmpR family regulator